MLYLMLYFNGLLCFMCVEWNCHYFFIFHLLYSCLFLCCLLVLPYYMVKKDEYIIVDVDPKPFKVGYKTQCPKFKQQSAINSNRYDIGCQLLLITNKKSHAVYRLVQTSVNLNDLERRNSLFLLYFTEFDSSAGILRHSG